MSEKISMQTSKLFTLRFLAKHPTTAPIIMKYLGLNWYYRAKRHSSELSENICCSDKASDCLQLAMELDNVPVQSLLLKSFTEDFKLWYKNMRTGDNPIDNMLSMFTAACEGATEEDELDPICLLGQKIESEAKKFIEVVTDDYNDIKQYVAIASDLANRRVADYKNQCEDLQKNLRKHAEEIAKTIAPPNLMNIHCFKSEAKNDYRICI